MIFKFLKIIAIAMLSSISLHAQNKDLSLSKKFTQEVYRGTEYASEKHIAFNQSLIDRVQVVEIKDEPTFQYTLLSQVNFMDKYNYLTRDDKSNFDKNHFNPLKYEFNYYNKENKIVYYRVDNSPYYILIHPLSNK